MAKGEGKVEVSEGGPLMDPQGQDFQAMLDAAKAGALEKAAAKVEKEDKPKEEPAKETPEPDKEADDKDEADVETDDAATLKEQLKGLKSELARVRKQRSASSDEAGDLKERIANLEGQLTTLKETKTQATVESRIAALSDEQVGTLLKQWQDEKVDARVDAKQAKKDGDEAALAEAQQRLATADKAIELYEKDQSRRATEGKAKQESASDASKKLATELDTMFTEAYEAMPDLKDKDSELWKAGKAEYDKYPTLMKQLGALGELVAMSRAIAKNPKLVGGGKVKEVVKDIENALEKSFNKGGSAPSGGTKPKQFNISSQKDAQDFEKLVQSVKHG